MSLDYQTWKYIRKPNKLSTNISLVSISRKLLNEKKINYDFLDKLTFITYEELIALKLEQTAKVMGTPYLGFSLWNTLKDICRDALVKYAYSLGVSPRIAAGIVGLSKDRFVKHVRKYHPKLYFKDYLKEKVKRRAVFTTPEDEIVEKTYK